MIFADIRNRASTVCPYASDKKHADYLPKKSFSFVSSIVRGLIKGREEICFTAEQLNEVMEKVPHSIELIIRYEDDYIYIQKKKEK